MAKDKVVVEDIVNDGIIEGFNSGIQRFLQELDEDLKRDAVIQENGSAYDHLQELINESITEPATNIEELRARIKQISL
jgi:uncharacterized protein YwgA